MKYFFAGFFAVSFLCAQFEKRISFIEKLVFHVEKNQKIQNFDVLTDDSLMFTRNGAIRSITRYTKTNVYNVTWPKKTIFSFNSKGIPYSNSQEYLASCEFASTIIVNGFPCTNKISWFPSGKLRAFTLSRPHKVDSYFCDAKDVEIFENGKIAYCVLAKNTIIDGYLCATERIKFSANGQLTYFTLAKDKLINNILFHKGSIIMLGSNGKILNCYVSKTTKINNFLVGTYTRDKIEFYSNGQIKSFGLLESAVIDGYFCRGGYVAFHPNGRLKYATLAKSQKIKGLYCDAKHISFYSNGQVERCYLLKLKMQNGIMGIAHSGFFPNGNFKHTHLAKNTKIKNKTFSVGDTVTFDNEGILTSYYLAKEKKIFNEKFKKGTTFNFYKNGKIKSIILQQKMRIQNYPCSAHQQVNFYKNGKIKNCIIAETVKINNRIFSSGTLLFFHENSKFKNSHNPSSAQILPPKYFDPKYFVSKKYKHIIIPNNVDVRKFVQIHYQ